MICTQKWTLNFRSVNKIVMSIEIETPVAALGWQDVKNRVQAIAPELAQLLNEVCQDRNLPVVVASYPYGHDIVKSGEFSLPPALVTPAVTEQLNYSKTPVGLILDKSIEVYYETAERVVPDKIWGAGTIIGLWELFDKPAQIDSCQYSNVSAGARSIFMLPKISDRSAHARIQKLFKFRDQPPTAMRDHRNLFAKFVNNSATNTQWFCRILYLTKDWFADVGSAALAQLHSYFLNQAWIQSYNCRRQFELHVAWESVLNAMRKKDIYLQPRLSSHIKQLYLISEGIFPGMVFAEEQDEDIAPIGSIQRIYRDVYQLKNHEPLIMRPQHLTQNAPVYYSLNFPSYFETHVPVKSVPRLADETRFLADIIKIIEDEVGMKSAANPRFKFYHSQTESNTNVLPSSQLVFGDPKLHAYALDGDASKFPANSLFFRGCIKIQLP